MIKRIAQWLSGIIRAEVTKVESDAAGIYPHVSNELAKLREDFTSGITELRVSNERHIQSISETLFADLEKAVSNINAHVSTEVERPVEALTKHIEDEITKQFGKILKSAGTAAETALADARKTLRMPCDVCKTMSWKFTVDPAGKVICGDCQIKGKV